VSQTRRTRVLPIASPVNSAKATLAPGHQAQEDVRDAAAFGDVHVGDARGRDVQRPVTGAQRQNRVGEQRAAPHRGQQEETAARRLRGVIGEVPPHHQRIDEAMGGMPESAGKPPDVRTPRAAMCRPHGRSSSRRN
jgi:hypothetical protein